MKKIMLFSLLVVSMLSFANEKSAEQIMDELREKIAKREEAKLREEQERLRREEEVRKEKEAMKLLKEKRRQIVEEPLEEKYIRGKDKAIAYEKALATAESRMSFKEVKNSEDPVVKEYRTNISKKYDDTNEEIQKNLAEKELIEEQLKALDELEEKVKNW